MSTKRTYTKDFKKDAVKLLVNSNKSMSQAADSLGIHEANLRRWKDEYQDEITGEIKKSKIDPKDLEIKRLKKEISDLTMEREILKKAMAIFSKAQK